MSKAFKGNEIILLVFLLFASVLTYWFFKPNLFDKVEKFLDEYVFVNVFCWGNFSFIEDNLNLETCLISLLLLLLLFNLFLDEFVVVE